MTLGAATLFADGDKDHAMIFFAAEEMSFQNAKLSRLRHGIAGRSAPPFAPSALWSSVGFPDRALRSCLSAIGQLRPQHELLSDRPNWKRVRYKPPETPAGMYQPAIPTALPAKSGAEPSAD